MWTHWCLPAGEGNGVEAGMGPDKEQASPTGGPHSGAVPIHGSRAGAGKKEARGEANKRRVPQCEQHKSRPRRKSILRAVSDSSRGRGRWCAGSS